MSAEVSGEQGELREFSRAAVLFSSGRFAEAEQLFRELDQMHPGRADLLSRLGHLALLGNRLDEAVKLLASALDINPQSSSAWNLLARAYYRRGELGSAAYCYERLGRRELAATLAAMAHCTPYALSGEGLPVDLPWLTTEPLPVISAAVNGQTANLVLDTGAGDLVLDEDFAISAGVHFGGRENRRFAGGRAATVWYGYAQELRLDRLTLTDLPVQAMPLRTFFAPFFTTHPIHGILGTAVLSQFIATLDYGAAALSLAPLATAIGEPRVEHETDTGVTPFWIAGRHCLVACGGVPGPHPCLVFLDTGMAGSAFAVPHSTADAAGLEPDSDTAEAGYSGGGQVAGRRVLLDRVCLGSVCRRDMAGMLIESFPLEVQFGFRITGLLAHDFFRGCRLTLDFGSMSLALQCVNSP